MTEGKKKRMANLKTPSHEKALKIGRAGGIASGKAKRERKLLVDALREILAEKAPNSNMTKMEAIIHKVVNDTYKRGDIYKLEKLQKILGESTQKVEVSMPSINVQSQADADIIASLINRQEED